MGYHGCDQSVADKVVVDGYELIHSKQPFDWLGSGAYFWENDPRRAMEFARWKRFRNPTVVGAAIDLGHCLDLSMRENLLMLATAYKSLKAHLRTVGKPIPKNLNAKNDPNGDLLLRYRDCAVIDHLHETIAQKPSGSPIREYDTVRGLFIEGRHVYAGAKFFDKTHVQIAVRTKESIKGLFYVDTTDL